MAATDAKAFPVVDTAYRIYFVIKSSTAGNPITGGLTGLGAQLFKDGASPVSSTNAPVEMGSGTGYGYLDLTASEMNYSAVVARVYASNSNAVEFQAVLLTDGLTQVPSSVLVTPANKLSTDSSGFVSANNLAVGGGSPGIGRIP